MKYKITNSNKLMIIASIILVIIIIALLIGFNTINKKEEEVSKRENVEENLNEEEPTGEYVDMEELENAIDQNVIEGEQPKEENGDNENNGNKPNNIDKTKKYYIKINYGAQVVTIYKKDENGDYTVPVKAMVCSTGTYTPKSGVYGIKERWTWLGLQGNVYGHYSTQINGNILFHSVPYLRRGDNSSLEWWEYDKLGTFASAECIRLQVKDAKWIFDNCARGTQVEFYSSSNPGPLGKPSAKKISSYPDHLKNWDPTDPDSRNPWRTYKEEEPEKPNPPKNEIVNDVTNEEVNDIVNDIANEVVNEDTNEVQNETEEDTNEIVNNEEEENNNEVANNEINDDKNNNNLNEEAEEEDSNVMTSEQV